MKVINAIIKPTVNVRPEYHMLSISDEATNLTNQSSQRVPQSGPHGLLQRYEYLEESRS